MSEKFEVPEGMKRQYLIVGVSIEDVPGIVRSEVERALRRVRYVGGRARQFNATVRDYLAGRFGEAAPEGTYRCAKCGKVFSDRPAPRVGCLVLHPEGACCHYGEVEVPTPSAPAETPCLVHDFSGPLKDACTKCGRVFSRHGEPLNFRPEGRVLPGVPAQYTEAERAFLRELARCYAATPSLGAEIVAAARRVVSE